MNHALRTENLAITDVETTGRDWHTHEIIEIGLVVVSQPDLSVLEEFQVKVKPEHLENAELEALKVNGYTQGEWEDALPLREALGEYQRRVSGAIFMAHPVTFDYNFIDQAFKKTKLFNPLDFRTLDLISMVWATMKDETRLKRLSLRGLAEFFEIEPEPLPHRAINGARLCYQILKKLVERQANAKRAGEQTSFL